jgi:hypothetical protein
LHVDQTGCLFPQAWLRQRPAAKRLYRTWKQEHAPTMVRMPPVRPVLTKRAMRRAEQCAESRVRRLALHVSHTVAPIAPFCRPVSTSAP